MKNLIFLAITFIFINFAFLGCQTPALALPNEPTRLHNLNNGLIFGSITFPKERARFTSYFIQVRSLNDSLKIAKKNAKEIYVNPELVFGTKHVGQLDNGKTYLFVLERPADNYEISGIRLFTNSGIQILQKNGNVAGFTIPFKVTEKKITYVGNLVFDEYAAESDTVIRYKYNFERDSKALRELKSNIDWTQAENDTTRKIKYQSFNAKL